MAADLSKYSENVDKLCKKVNGSPVSSLEQLYPLSLQEYGTIAQFCQKFYCDGAVKRKDDAGNPVIVGYIDTNLTGCANHLFHANGRRGKWRMTQLVGSTKKSYVVLNDGGLNTKPFAEFSGNIIAAYTNFIKILCTLKSAYYVPTDKFTIDFYTVSNDVETWIHNMDLVVSNAADPRFLPAQGSLTQFAAKIRNLGGVVAGQTVRLKISATNAEGTFTHPTHKEAIIQAPMSFVQVYRFVSQPDFQNTDPTTGTPYAMLISQEMYSYNENYPLQGGDLGILLNGEAGDPGIIPGSKLQGVSGSAEDAYDSVIGDLPDGYYYGVPYKDFVGSNGLCYVRVNGNKIAWFSNQYAPVVPTAYTLEISFAGIFDNTTQKYYVDVYAKITGTLPNGGVQVTTTVCEGIDRYGALINPQNPITARVTTRSRTKISSTSIECEEGAFYQVANTYSTPASTTDNYITETPIHVNSTSIPHNQ